jgi:hypothetical protein
MMGFRIRRKSALPYWITTHPAVEDRTDGGGGDVLGEKKKKKLIFLPLCAHPVSSVTSFPWPTPFFIRLKIHHTVEFYLHPQNQDYIPRVFPQGLGSS